MLQIYLSLANRSASYLLPGALAILALSYPVISTADSYLESIEAEAGNTTVLQKAQKEHEKLKQLTSNTPAEKPQPKTAEAKAALKETVDKPASAYDISKFEAALYREFPGNYAVYTRLSEEHKKEVVAAYKNAGNVKGVARYGPSLTLILELASQ